MSDLISQIVDHVVGETLIGGRKTGNMVVDGQTATEISQFKTLLAAKLRDASTSGGGVESVSYQNSVMSSPVQAFVFKDESDNIYRVYEPIRNNDVSRSQFAYADSIDKFRFDKVENTNNSFRDVKLVSVGSDFYFQNNTIEGIVIKTASTTGNYIINTHWIGNGFGSTCPNEAEIYFTGNDSYLESVNVFGKFTFIDSLGDDCYVYAVNFICNAISIYFNDKTNVTLSASLIWEDGSQIYFVYDNVNLFDVSMGGASTFNVGGGGDQGNIIIGDGCTIGSQTKTYNSVNFLTIGYSSVIQPSVDNTDTISYVDVGMGISMVNTSGNKSRQSYIRIGSTKYLMGESGGVMTLTSV